MRFLLHAPAQYVVLYSLYKNYQSVVKLLYGVKGTTLKLFNVHCVIEQNMLSLKKVFCFTFGITPVLSELVATFTKLNVMCCLTF